MAALTPHNADPRKLDPKFKDETVKDEKPDVEDNGVQIVFRQQVVENGVAKEIVHGPMPREDWPAYEKEHGL